MIGIFEKLYNEYLIILNNLEIGYGFDNCDLSEVWKLINVLYFLKFGELTEEDMLWLADRYEIAEAFLEDFDFEGE